MRLTGHLPVLARLGHLVGLALLLCAQAGHAQTFDAISRLAEPEWARRHLQKLAELHEHPVRLVLLGDSITAELQRKSPDPLQDINAVWEKYFKPLDAIDLGFAGDTTSNLLWRIRNGEVDGIAPECAVVLIGTNDQSRPPHYGPDQSAAMIAQIMRELRQKLPQTKLLLLGLQPKAVGNDTVTAINARLRAQNWAALRVTYIEIGNVLLSGGQPDPTLYLDPLLQPPHAPVHPNARGWALLAAALQPYLHADALAGGQKDKEK